MTLASGTRLGPLEIVGPLGAGGPPSLVLTSYGAAMRLS